MKNESMIDAAYSILTANDGAMAFKDLWEKLKVELEIGPDEEASRIGRFYTDLSLDGRFVEGKDNTWNLRSRICYDNVHIDMSDVYTDLAESDGDDADKQDNADYDASVQGVILTDEAEPEEDEENAHKPETAEDLGIKNIA